LFPVVIEGGDPDRLVFDAMEETIGAGEDLAIERVGEFRDMRP